MFYNRLAAAAALCAVAGCSSATRRATTVESGGEAAVAVVTPSNNRTIPIGAELTATLDQALGTKISKTGETFSATVAQTLYASDGSVVVPAGAKIRGRVTGLDDSDNAADPALIRLDFDQVTINGTAFPFSAAIVQSHPVQTTSPRSGVDATKKIVIGGAVGAAIGGLLSHGDMKKIVIGGAIGAAAGSLISLGTEVNATLPAGSQMMLQATKTTTLR